VGLLTTAVDDPRVKRWQEEFSAMSSTWTGNIVEAERSMIAGWAQGIVQMDSEEDSWRAAGQWLIGPVDWLAVLGRTRHEMTHSRLLGWLCDPVAQHGLGIVFLHEFLTLARCPSPAHPAAAIDLEVTGRSLKTRADIVITLPDRTVVIENKVDAPESPLQCDLLAGDHPWPAHLVLLQVKEGPPDSAPGSGERWRTTTWRDVSMALSRCLPLASGPAAYIAIEYEKTLRRLFQ
jgi:hypothetical protein